MFELVGSSTAMLYYQCLRNVLESVGKWTEIRIYMISLCSPSLFLGCLNSSCNTNNYCPKVDE